MILMNKIVQFNENLNACKEILNDKLLHKLNILVNKIDETINSQTSINKVLNELIGIVVEQHEKFGELSHNITIYGEKIKEISYEIIERQDLLLYSNEDEYVKETLEISNLDKILMNKDLESLRPESLELLVQKMVINYQINYFLSNILLLELLIKNLYTILNKVDIKHNYQLKNSSFIYILFKIIFYYLYYCVSFNKYIQSKGSNYSNNLINYPDNYIKITQYIGENILKILNGNGCYCENEIIIDKEHSTIKFNLLFSDLEINLNLLKIFNSIENKICNSDQNLSCKVFKKSKIEKENDITDNSSKFKTEVDIDKFPEDIRNKLLLHQKIYGKGVRKYHTSTRTNVNYSSKQIIEMKETDFKDKKNYSESLFNILEKIKHLTSTPYDPKEVQQLIENH